MNTESLHLEVKTPNAEAIRLRKMAERMRRDGRTATAILLDNAAWIAEGNKWPLQEAK